MSNPTNEYILTAGQIRREILGVQKMRPLDFAQCVQDFQYDFFKARRDRLAQPILKSVIEALIRAAEKKHWALRHDMCRLGQTKQAFLQNMILLSRMELLIKVLSALNDALTLRMHYTP